MVNEVWKEIKNYKNYSVSSCGRVRNIKRDNILRISLTVHGYPKVRLYNNGIGKTFTIHKLVSNAFLKEKGEVTNHKDFNKENNHVSNLERISQRENVKHSKQRLNSYSRFTGVSYWKRNRKWGATIFFNGKNKFLGLFDREIDAKNKYESFLLTLNT